MAQLEAQLSTGGPAKDTVAKVAEEFRSFRELMLAMLRILRQQITECCNMVDVMETRHRRKALLFLGIEESENEDCSSLLYNIMAKNMSLQDRQGSIAVCHRVGNKSKAHHRPILVWFSNLDSRSAVWKAKSKLKGSSITVREFLTKSRQAVFSKARHHFGMRPCWTQDGIIVVKVADGSRHKISNMDELNSLVTKFPKVSSSNVSSVGSKGGPVVAGISGVNSKTRKN